MSDKKTWWHWFSTHRGVNTALILFNAILIAAMWYTVYGVVQVEREDTIRAAINRNDNLAIAFEQYTIRTIESADTVIQYLGREYARSGEKMDLAKFVVDYTVDNALFTGLVLADERGNALTTAAGKTVRSLNVADREHFRVHLGRDSGNVFVGKPVAGRVTGKMIIPITRRINKPDGTFGGVAMAVIEHARFTDVLHEAKLRPRDVIALVGLDGITRARLKGTTVTAGEDVSKSPLFAEQSKRSIGNYFARSEIDGVPKFFSYRTLPAYQVIVTVGAAEADVMAGFEQRRTRYFMAAGLASVLIAGFMLLLMQALAAQLRAAAAVARSQVRFLATFNQIAVGIAHSDPDGRYLEVNQKLCDILGYTREELLARSFADITHPDDVSSSIDFRRQLLAELDEGKSIEREKRYVRKDGTIVWCTITASCVYDNTGKVDYVVIVVQDISDRKKMEDAARASERTFRELVNNLPAAVYVCSASGVIESYNQRAVELWGREPRIGDSEEHFCESYRLYYLDGTALPYTESPKMQVLRTGIPAANQEIIAERPDGSRCAVLINAIPRRDGQGMMTGVIQCIIDITDRLDAERRTAELLLYTQTLIDAAPVGIVTFKATGECVTANNAIAAMAGASVESLRAQNFRQNEGWKRTGLLAAAEGALAGGAPREMEVHTVNTFDKEVWLHGRLIPFRYLNEPHLLCFFDDIRERKEAESALREYAAQMSILYRRLYEAEENEKRKVNRELHDRVGTNLAALHLDLVIIGSMLPGELQQTVRARIQAAQNVLKDTTAQVRDLMANLRPPALDDYGLLAALRTYADSYAERLGVAVDVDGDEIVPRPPSSVETALFRIAQEALNNIAKHAHAKHIEITLHVDDGRIMLWVGDDGIGFNADAADPKRVTWGLKTMRERAQAIGAALRVESAPGQGTRIMVELTQEAA